MTSGNRLRRAALALIVCLWACPAGAAEPLTLDGLMSLRQSVKSSSATFTETRTLSLLDQPIESSGTLLFVAPDQMEKHTLAPHVERLIVKGDQVTVDQGKGRPRKFRLGDSAEMGALIASIRGTLAGDQAALEHYYSTDVEGTAEAWQLVLTPRRPEVQALVDSVRITGGGQEIHTVETVEHGGDHSLMTITATGP